jgi:pseudouridine synthase
MTDSRGRSKVDAVRADRSKAPARAPTDPVAKQRLQKVLARAGVASRRHAEQLVREGRVRVGGKVIEAQGTLVDPLRDQIEVDGRPIAAEPLTYLLFHKPRQVVCTMHDPAGRRSVADFVSGVGVRVVPVGRLDYQTSGVMLLTNDGAFARGLLHPSCEVLKEYVLKVKGEVDQVGLERFRDSIDIGGRRTAPARVARLRAWRRLTAAELRSLQNALTTLAGSRKQLQGLASGPDE